MVRMILIGAVLAGSLACWGTAQAEDRVRLYDQDRTGTSDMVRAQDQQHLQTRDRLHDGSGSGDGTQLRKQDRTKEHTGQGGGGSRSGMGASVSRGGNRK
jgi:hypothetical protein